MTNSYFYPRPPRGGRPAFPYNGYVYTFISIHALREEGDRVTLEINGDFCISIHALREEGDILWSLCAQRPSDFYPRPPRGGRRRSSDVRRHFYGFLSTPSARRATCPPAPVSCTARIFLSTPSARRATAERCDAPNRFKISIHALREEGDRFPGPVRSERVEFLSTPSARRATSRWR